MTVTCSIEGQCEGRFDAVDRAFRDNFTTHAEVGAAVAIVYKGKLVVDLWGGHADARKTRPWQADTLTNVWSTTKGVAAICFAMLVERGKVSYEDRVAAFWPEFSVNGKADITLGQLLSHQAGLCGFAAPVTLQDILDQHRAEQMLATQAPLWAPGTACGYHAVTYGTLMNALFTRIDGRSPAQFLADELATPHGLDISIGLPDDQTHRASEIMAPPTSSSAEANPEPSPEQQAALANPVLDPLDANTAAWRRAPLPSVNGFATATALARLYGMLANGGQLDDKKHLSQATIDQASRVRIEGEDLVLGLEARWAAGFLGNVHNIYGDKATAFGHSGWGGSFAFADPDRGLAMAYVMNAMGSNLVGDPRAMALLAAALRSVDQSQ